MLFATKRFNMFNIFFLIERYSFSCLKKYGEVALVKSEEPVILELELDISSYYIEHIR